MICHYWIFNHGFKLQDFVCNICHNLTIAFIGRDIVIITVKNVDYRYIIHNITKSEACNLSESCVLEDRVHIKKILS